MTDNVRILYYRREAVLSDFNILLGKVNADLMNKTHVEVYKARLEYPEQAPLGFLNDLFEKFNGNDNPLSNAESQEMIVKNGLHTSMSVGDVVELINGNSTETWVCKRLDGKR